MVIAFIPADGGDPALLGNLPEGVILEPQDYAAMSTADLVERLRRASAAQAAAEVAILRDRLKEMLVHVAQAYAVAEELAAEKVNSAIKPMLDRIEQHLATAT